MLLFNIFMMLILQGCGFTPLYSQHRSPGLQAELGRIYIKPVFTPEGTYGATLRNLLKDRLTPKGMSDRQKYDLDIVLKQERKYQAVQSDAIATRLVMTYTAIFSLKDLSLGHVVFQNQTKAIVGYNVLESIYATNASERDAKERAMVILADDITTHISAFIKSPTEYKPKKNVQDLSKPI